MNVNISNFIRFLNFSQNTICNKSPSTIPKLQKPSPVKPTGGDTFVENTVNTQQAPGGDIFVKKNHPNKTTRHT